MASRTVFAAEERTLLERARDAILEVESGARIVLYGSRARGTAEPESDWDLLVLLDGDVDAHRRKAVHDRLLKLELATGTVLSATVFGKDEWDSPRLRVQPLRANVEDDGIELAPGREDDRAAGEELTERAMAEAREDLVREWLERAHQELTAAERLAQVGLGNACVNRLYYACFHAVRALLLQRGLRFSKHSSVQGQFNRYFAKTGLVPADLAELYNTLFKARGQADYTAFVRFGEADVRPWLEDARRFITLVEGLIQSVGEEKPPA